EMSNSNSGRTAEQLLAELGIAPSNAVADDELYEITKNAGHDLEALFDNGHGFDSEAVQDALFLSESVAQQVLSRDVKRLVALSDDCAISTASLKAANIVDLGGGCGLTVMHAAELRPDHQFFVVDRSKNALKVGSILVEKL